MDKFDPNNNKIGESFENHLPEEQLPDFIWDNILQQLNTPVMETDAVSTIKNSFESGFEEELLPTMVWDDIVGELEANSTLSSEELVHNKIKDSFEHEFQDAIPTDVWTNLENQLEIETVWKKLSKTLNQRTRKRYWREKAMQMSLVVLALFWLKSCEIGNGSMITPATFASNEKVEQVSPTTVDVITSNKHLKNSLANQTTDNNNLITIDKTITKKETSVVQTSAQTQGFGKNQPSRKFGTFGKVGFSQNPADSETKEREHTLETVLTKKEAVLVESQGFVEEFIINNQTLVSTPTISTVIISNETETTILVEDKINHTITKEELEVSTNNKTTVLEELTIIVEETIEAATKQDYSIQNLATIAATAILDSNIQSNFENFVIQKTTIKKGFHPRFELGLIGKIGTSVLLGNTTHKALESTSMVNTKIRPDGLVGIQLNCFLTNNDAITLVAAPYSSHQQYFGGYTQEGRFYNKEIKLSYLDFSVGYQRVLLHYNDFGNLPSTMYARVEYGLGYLSNCEEVVNGESVEMNHSYNNINHQIGLAIGNTHQLKRLVIDYGIYANVGLNAVQNNLDHDNLVNFGGYLGLRYRL